jgi:hypothetical protein
MRADGVGRSGVRQRRPREADRALQRGIRHQDSGPHGRQEFVLGHDAIAVSGQVDEQVEHPRLQFEHASVRAKFAGGFVDLERAEAVDHGGRRRESLIRSPTVRKRSGHGKDFGHLISVGWVPSTPLLPVFHHCLPSLP